MSTLERGECKDPQRVTERTFITSSLSLSQRTNTLELKESGSDVASEDTSWANRLARTMPPLPPLVAADRTDDAKW